MNPESPENPSSRLAALKALILRLHEGEDLDTIRLELAGQGESTSPGEVLALEQELLAEGLPLEELQAYCDLHTAVLRDFLPPLEASNLPPGHPLDTFHRENLALASLVRALRAAFQVLLTARTPQEAEQLYWLCRQAASDLMDIEKHYLRKRRLLYPVLETKNITCPTQVMQAKDAEILASLTAMHDKLAEDPSLGGNGKTFVSWVAEPALKAVEEMIYKEDNILFPIAHETLTGEEWDKIRLDSPRFGWCLTEPRDGFRPSSRTPTAAGDSCPEFETLFLRNGILSLPQLEALFQNLPADLTFVDADDIIRFYSDGSEPVVPRKSIILGRRARYAYPPKHVDKILSILEDFHAGRREYAEHIFEFRRKTILARYYALRGETGAYLGALEFKQIIGEGGNS
ncbi:MAG: DUF438 domain-containing protein [Candidatus Omnitrophica bacterium]|nr:DUF438 domain-containing protein [Candidatus Omnitrophota bacterium]